MKTRLSSIAQQHLEFGVQINTEKKQQITEAYNGNWVQHDKTFSFGNSFSRLIMYRVLKAIFLTSR